jgi:signal transduction histidine kinase
MRTKLLRWETVRRLLEVLEPPVLPQALQLQRIRFVERDIMIPVKTMFVGVLAYYLFVSTWMTSVSSTREVALEALQRYFYVYLLMNVGVVAMLLNLTRLPLRTMQVVLFGCGLLDSVMLAGLTLITGGFESIIYWMFPALIVRNAMALPLALPQLTLNFLVIGFYLVAGLLDVAVEDLELAALDEASRRALGLAAPENPAEPFLLRLMVLLFVTICCYGLQMLFERNRRAKEEGQEFALRQEQVRAAGRVAAEVAHQIKNPLGIINNAAFMLQRTMADAPELVRQQVQIIREEVERSDRIVTELMGYAQLAEGQVERLDMVEELERALGQVFPTGAGYKVEIQREFERNLPPVLMQRGHLSGVIVNLFTNAREAMEGRGRLGVVAKAMPDLAVELVVTDSGPGIAPHHLEKIFDAHYTTKPRGTGLGLAIVRHNVEIYGGTVRVESELGKGARFILRFPSRTLSKLEN